MFITIDFDIPNESIAAGTTAYEYGMLLEKSLQYLYTPYGVIVQLGGVLGGPGTGVKDGT